MILHSIIFTKDRLPQCDLLLRSLFRFYTGAPETNRVSVLWKATAPHNVTGYKELESRYSRAEFVQETSLADDIRRLSLEEADLVQWIVDDDVFCAPWSLEDKEIQSLINDPLVCSVALRQAPWMDFCYPMNIVTPPPPMLTGRKWCWYFLVGDWGYPNSVDGNLYRWEDMKETVKQGAFTSVSTFEPALRPACQRPLMVCYPFPRILNISGNSNQTDAQTNRNAGLDQNTLDQRYFGGEKISLDPLLNMHQRSPHFEFDYQWWIGESKECLPG